MTKKRLFSSIIMVFVLIFLFGGCESASTGQIIKADAEPEEKTDGSSMETKVQEESRDGSFETDSKDSFLKTVGKTGVYIYGAVNKPGVYYLDSNSRVVDLVKAAGGFKENAYRTGVNLAAYLKDADVVRILTKKQAKRLKKENAVQEAEDESVPFVSEEVSKKDDTVNINSAGKEELMSLKGIGESKAEAIIAYREEHGSFKSIEEIMEISGIKEGTFNKIKSKITI